MNDQWPDDDSDVRHVTARGRMRRLAGRVRDWWRRQEMARRVLEVDAHERGRLSQDLGIAEGDLFGLLRATPAGETQLPRMMRRFGLDTTVMHSATRSMVRDLQRVCAMCPHKRRCAHALAANAPARVCRGFCPNAAALDELSSNADRHMRW